jgi:hypothetical protein
VFNAVGAIFMDKVGRKPLMLFGVGGCCVCLIIEAAIVATYAEEATNKAALAAGVAMYVPFSHSVSLNFRSSDFQLEVMNTNT